MGAWIVFSEKLHEPESGGRPGDRARAMFRAVWREREFGMHVKEDAKEVAFALGSGFAPFTRVEGGNEKQVWVNPANVLYVEQYDESKSERERQEEAAPQVETES